MCLQVECDQMRSYLADTDEALSQLTLHRAIQQLVESSDAPDKAEIIVDTVERFLVLNSLPCDSICHTILIFVPVCVGAGERQDNTGYFVTTSSASIFAQFTGDVAI